MKKNTYLVGKIPPLWKDGLAQSITFIVTEDCNLRCKYCYITHKSSKKKLNLIVAKKFIDFILSDVIEQQPAVVLEFIGGEPLLEPKLIDEITKYFIQKAFEVGSDWYWNYMISICTNGVNFDSNEVQTLIENHKNNISISITVDGIKEKHDLNRVFLDNTGSYDTIKKNVPLWLQKFVGSTKVTFASKDLIFLKDSIISLWDNGITDVAANVVFENAWKENDDLIFEKQLKLLADYVLDNEIYDKYYCTLFSDDLGGYYENNDFYQTYCGAGKMMAVGPNGIIYPCIRYKDYSLNKQKERSIGNIDVGIDMEKVRPFMLASVKYQSDSECLNCEIAKGCAFCQGFNYDESESSTNFYRAKYICKMHKARVRANDYYFSKLFNRFQIEKDSQLKGKEEKIMYILESNKYSSFCNHTHNNINDEIFNNLIEESLEYARQSFAIPIIIHSDSVFHPLYFENYRAKHILPFKFYEQSIASNLKDCIYVFDDKDCDSIYGNIALDHCILNISVNNLNSISRCVKKLFTYTDSIKLNITNLDNSFDKQIYLNQLLEIKDLIFNNPSKKINVLTELIDMNSHRGCKAGEKCFTISPEGNIYVCPAFYDLGIENKIGDISNINIKFNDKHLFSIEYKPLCQSCDVYHCSKCCHLNLMSTREVNVPPSFQCIKSSIEKKVSIALYNQLGKQHSIKASKYDDPLEDWIEKHDLSTSGFYKLKEKTNE